MHSAWAAFVLGAFIVKAAYPSPRQTVFKSLAVSENSNASHWSLTEESSINSTSHLIFATVSSFLQHWPNTRYRNGHNIIPGTVPVGTLLYHGTSKNEIPKMPEWTATDPEHSYLFCRSIETDSGCWHLTLVATRPLKVLYFDGSSAAKMLGGPMDSQDLVTWGEVRPDWTMREKQRINDLCDWGQKYRVDGFLRMEMDFEIMLCDFSAGVKPVSFLNLAPADKGEKRRGPPPREPLPILSRMFGAKNGMQDAEPKALVSLTITPPQPTALFRVLEAGSWHNNFPGDPRIQLDYTRLISFYDPVMFPSLQAARLGQERLEHRLEGISPADVKAFALRLEEVLTDGPENSGSGVDWQNLIRVITNRFAERLELLHYILNSTSTIPESSANVILAQAHRHIASMIAPYILHSSVPPGDSGTPANHSWAEPVFELCATTHTRYLETDKFVGELTPSEQVLLYSVKGVSKEICRILVGMWAEGMEAGWGKQDTESQSAVSLQELAYQWKSKVESLMAWLDWSYWLRCRPACGYEEMCYLPTWPFFTGWRRRPIPLKSPFLYSWPQPPREPGEQIEDDPDEGEWVDPQPRCIRRVEPLEFEDDFAEFTQVV